ncbi:MAG: ferrous iron transporter B [Candidatus Micrarchaeota archaeon]
MLPRQQLAKFCGTSPWQNPSGIPPSGSPGTKKLRIALAGNANVGKSALFNHLTGLSQHVANWPGKTVEMAEGKLHFHDYEMDVIDLPGIYSFSTFSIEERVSEEYITKEKPDVVINVIDSAALERNLFFTLQLLELGVPVVIALNQSDVARKRGITIDEKKLSRLLRVPVVPTVATKGIGVQELIWRCIEAAGKSGKRRSKRTPSVKPPSIALSSRRYATAGSIASRVQISTPQKGGLAERIDDLTTHRFFGYLIMLIVLGGVFYSIFAFGGFLSSEIGNFFNAFRPPPSALTENLVWEGLVGGFVAGLTLVLPYVLPFYFLLSLLEDTGYITRVAYLLDGIAHRIGFHGKAIIPLLLGYGCNVPACIGCRMMEYERDRLITAFAVTLVPCTARTVVILALVGAFLGIQWAAAIYLLNLIVVAALAKIAFRILPGEPVGLIMEMPRYRVPSLSVAAKQTFLRTKSLLTIVFPYYIAGGLVLALLQLAGILSALNGLFSPLTSGWLGLPAFAGTLLLFGVVRKELVVVLPAVLYGTADLSSLFTPVQMLVLTIVTIFYIPCLATIETLRREFGWKKALAISAFEIIFAILLGGIAYRILTAFLP